MIRKNQGVLWLSLIVCFIVLTACTPKPSLTIRTQNPPVLTSEPTKEAPTPTSVTLWHISTTTDEMSGEVSLFATSPKYSPTHQMGFPYDDVVAWIGVGCSKEGEWAYIGYSRAPNLTNTDIEDGYDRISTRIKWDDSIEYVDFTQEWGDRFLHFSDDSDDSDVIQKLKTHDTLMLELKWYGEGSVYFEFPLVEAKESIESMRLKCGY